MVTRPAAREDGRGQMILIGAVVVAVLIVGLAIVVNGIVAPGTAEIDDRARGLDDARAFDAEAGSGTGSLVLRLNHDHRNASAAERAAVVDRHVRNYSHLLAESYVHSRGVYANVTYDNASSTFGERIVQQGNATVVAADGSAEWEPVTVGENAELGRFVLNVDVSDTSEQGFSINVTNAGGTWLNASINRTTVDDEMGLRIETDVTGSGGTTARCGASQGRVLLDLVTGDTFASSCTFNGTHELEPPHGVVIEDGDRAVARYGIVVNESTTVQPCDAATPTSEPCATPVVWTANVSTRFETRGLVYRNDHNVSIYGGRP